MNYFEKRELLKKQEAESPLKVTATVLEFDKPNLNRRIYPSSLVKSVIDQYKSHSERGFFGMLDNPSSGKIVFSQVSHIVTRLWVEQDNKLEQNNKPVVPKLMCEIETTDTPCGRVLRGLLKDHPETVAFRPMGIGGGQVNQDGFLVIGDGYKLISINAVAAHEAS